MSLTTEQSIELQRWIIDPSSRPYERKNKQQEPKLVSRSAGSEYVTYQGTEPKCNVQKQLELQKRILGTALDY
jgi:hypothetical protein